MYTPFPYQLYFPVSVYMGKAKPDEAVRGLALQFLSVLWDGLARFAWSRGIKHYSAVGG